MQLPQPIRHALKVYARHYNAEMHDYSCTELLQPRQLVQLRKRHPAPEKITDDDLSKSLASFIGTAVHSQVEKKLWGVAGSTEGSRRYILERRFHEDISDRRISGQWDIYDAEEETLYDIKTVTAWKLAFGIDKAIAEWTKQQNMYCYLANNHSGGVFRRQFPIEQMFIIAIVMDWSSTGAYNNPSYPKEKIIQVPLEVWSPGKQRDYMHEIVEAHKACEIIPDVSLPMCTAEEMWEKQSVFALMQKGRKKALRLMDSKEELEEYQQAKEYTGKKFYIEYRPGERVRCNSYCDMQPYCYQHREYICREK